MKFFKIILLSMLFVGICNATEKEYEVKARKALEVIVNEQMMNLVDKTNTTNSGNEKNIKGYVLSSDIRGFSDIPENIDRDIRLMQDQIQLLIRRIAVDIELHGKSGVLKLASDGSIIYKEKPNLPKKLNEKRKLLMEAHLANSVSVRSAELSIRLLAGINGELKDQAKNAKTRGERERIYLRQAIYVYEMADITLNLINKLNLDGKDILLQLHSDAKIKKTKRIKNIEKQLEKAKSLHEKNLINITELEREQETYELMRRANEKSMESWTKLMNEIDKKENFLNNIKEKKELIEYKREKARVQLETLRDLREVAELKDTIGSFDNLIASVANLELLVLDEKTVNSLLGLVVDE